MGRLISSALSVRREYHQALPGAASVASTRSAPIVGRIIRRYVGGSEKWRETNKMEWARKELYTNLPIKSWCKDVEAGAMAQAVDLTNHPILAHHVALMPDCHQGYGMPIGGVVAARNAVIPNAVGVDIGCGMVAVQSDYRIMDLGPEEREELIKAILGDIRKAIPVGFEHHKDVQHWEGFYSPPPIPVVMRELQASAHQLGTLGGGNHFIELQHDEMGFLWIMIHSGSRNFGYKIANEYNLKALESCAKYHSRIPNKDLAFLPADDEEGRNYLQAMQYALEFAQANRDLMLTRVMGIITKKLPGYIVSSPSINIHHNFAALENHFGEDLWIHRKGATSAKLGQIGIIPGSMGTASYIVLGLGNADSFESCSHGAGRKMGRGEASKTLTLDECNKAMEGVVFGRWNTSKKKGISYDFSEAPGAYKDIDTVLSSERDLVSIAAKLKPLGVIKG